MRDQLSDRRCWHVFIYFIYGILLYPVSRPVSLVLRTGMFYTSSYVYLM